MKITIEPTEELYEFPVPGAPVCRIWKGQTDKGTAIEAYVTSIVPADARNRIDDEVPEFMSRSRDLHKLSR